jgi:hypothetical protein
MLLENTALGKNLIFIDLMICPIDEYKPNMCHNQFFGLYRIEKSIGHAFRQKNNQLSKHNISTRYYKTMVI